MVYSISNRRAVEVARLHTEDCVVKHAPDALKGLIGKHITEVLKYFESKGMAWTVVS